MTIIRRDGGADREEGVVLAPVPGPIHRAETVEAIEIDSEHQRTKQRRRRDWRNGSDAPWTC